MPRQIVIPVNNSASAQAAVDWTIANLINPQTDCIVLLNVRPEPSFGEYKMEASWEVYVEEPDLVQDHVNKIHSHQLLQYFVDQFIVNGISAKGIALRGGVLTELVWKINSLIPRPDLVIVGHENLSAVSRLLFHTSTSSYLARNLRIPVTVTRT